MKTKSKFLTAEWRKLAIANYAVDPAILKPYLPYKTEIDLWQDKCYVSLVGFRFINTRIRGIRIPFHSDFEEVNLRFYVRYLDGNEWKRGVTFIREIVPRPALTFVANTIYNEKYITLPMKHSWIISPSGMSVSYEWKHKGNWNSFHVSSGVGQQEIRPGSEEEFITEHYWGYTPVSKTLCSEYGVEHPRWKTYIVDKHQIKVGFGDLYGHEFSFLNHQAPDSVMLAEGSEIIVRAANKIR
jgi:uncharacterized protein YqjF (DUF2071 family)